MRIHHNKLVRDRIPEIIEADGKTYATEILNDTDYLAALKAKLIEEATEVAEATNRPDLIKELADLQEVISALTTLLELNPDEIAGKASPTQTPKRRFQKQIKLLWVE